MHGLLVLHTWRHTGARNLVPCVQDGQNGIRYLHRIWAKKDYFRMKKRKGRCKLKAHILNLGQWVYWKLWLPLFSRGTSEGLSHSTAPEYSVFSHCWGSWEGVTSLFWSCQPHSCLQCSLVPTVFLPVLHGKLFVSDDSIVLRTSVSTAAFAGLTFANCFQATPASIAVLFRKGLSFKYMLKTMTIYHAPAHLLGDWWTPYTGLSSLCLRALSNPFCSSPNCLTQRTKSVWARRRLLKASRQSDIVQCSAEGIKNPHSFPHSASRFPLYRILSSSLSPHDWNTGAAWLRCHQTHFWPREEHMYVWFYHHHFSELWHGRPTLSAGWEQILAFTASWRKKDREDRNRKQSWTC